MPAPFELRNQFFSDDKLCRWVYHPARFANLQQRCRESRNSRTFPPVSFPASILDDVSIENVKGI